MSGNGHETAAIEARPVLPAAQPSCQTCDFMRREGATMRCYYNPPTPHLVGAVPSKLQGGPPTLIVAGLTPEVSPRQFCRNHPLLRQGLSPGYGAEEVN
jgi:hypothetical protein